MVVAFGALEAAAVEKEKVGAAVEVAAFGALGVTPNEVTGAAVAVVEAAPGCGNENKAVGALGVAVGADGGARENGGGAAAGCPGRV